MISAHRDGSLALIALAARLAMDVVTGGPRPFLNPFPVGIGGASPWRPSSSVIRSG